VVADLRLGAIHEGSVKTVKKVVAKGGEKL
jgi:hypothetical protein